MKSKLIEWLAIVLIIQTGVLHFMEAQGWYIEAPYMGYVFMANVLASLLSAYGIYRKRAWGWALGAFVAGASIAGYIWSRTLGLPGTVVEEWFNPVGLVALTVEGLFLLLLVWRPWRIATDQSAPVVLPAIFMDALPTVGLILIALVSFSATQWAASAANARAMTDGHAHVASLGELCRTPLTTLSQLEDLYGVQIAQVAISALDSIVDVRFRIVDAEKAAALFNSHAALLVEQQSLILAPHMHNHDKLKSGGTYLIFFPTQRNTVHTGSEVSLVFGSLRVQPIKVK